MSISDEIKVLVDGERLFRLRPIVLPPRHNEIRQMYVSEEVNARITGPWADGPDEFRCGKAHADLLAFTYRDPLVIAKDPRHGGSSYASRLQPPGDEVWDIRCVDPAPGIRVLGRFANKNVFIGLTWEIRLNLKDFDSREWRDAIVRCGREWRLLFPAYDPLMGEYFADYLTDGVFDRDP
jgi:hypothetical protein